MQSLLRDNRGDSSIEFLVTTLLLVLVFATLITGFLFVTKYYNTAYICRRIVRDIETVGEYDATTVQSQADRLGEHTIVKVRYKSSGSSIGPGDTIQLLDEFTVRLETSYIITILTVGDRPIELPMNIAVELSGMSEVFHK